MRRATLGAWDIPLWGRWERCLRSFAFESLLGIHLARGFGAFSVYRLLTIGLVAKVGWHSPAVSKPSLKPSPYRRAKPVHPHGCASLNGMSLQPVALHSQPCRRHQRPGRRIRPVNRSSRGRPTWRLRNRPYPAQRRRPRGGPPGPPPQPHRLGRRRRRLGCGVVRRWAVGRDGGGGWRRRWGPWRAGSDGGR